MDMEEATPAGTCGWPCSDCFARCRAIAAEENKKPRKRRTTRKNEVQNQFFRPQKPLKKILRRCLARSQN